MLAGRLVASLHMHGDFWGTEQINYVQDGAKERNGQHRDLTAINHLRSAGHLRTKGSWVQILPGAPKFSVDIKRWELPAPAAFCFSTTSAGLHSTGLLCGGNEVR